MKRTVIVILGVAYGLFLTWICLYTLSHIDWPQSNQPATGCHEIDKCPMPWWAIPVLLAIIFGPTVVFGVLNALAWRRWTVQRWAWWFGGFTVLTIAHHSSGYLLRS
ncbi:MAG: hypothetical protein J0H69_06330 [Burkholderiales bacterium]|nr:hypothetical protein [Burkholderiales bacterium]